MSKSYRTISGLAVLVLMSVPFALAQAPAMARTPIAFSRSRVAANGASEFTFVPIVVGADATEPRGINNAGVIVGSYTNAFDSNYGFVLKNGVVTTIELPNSITQVAGINSSLELAGDYLPSDGRDNPKGFIFGNGNIMPVDPPGAIATEPDAINDAGSVVGSYYLESGYQGFLYRGGIFTTLSFPGATGTLAEGINNQGQIVGVWYDSNLTDYPFLYSDGQFQQLTVPGCENSGAFGINNHGDIVGFCSDPELGLGFLYQNGAFLLFSFPGATNTLAFAINDSGQIVGQYYPPGVGEPQGFLATPVP